MTIIDFFRERKIKAKKFYSVILLTIVEILLLWWGLEWQLKPVMLVPFIQFIAVFENRDIWKRMTEEEKKRCMLSEDDVKKFIRGIEKFIKDGKSSEDIIEEIKNS